MSTTSSGTIGDEAVAAKTGKSWSEWFALLDGAGAHGKTHKEIVGIVSGQFGVGPWWQQMVAVRYEQERGLRVRNQSCAGDHQVSVSKTLAASADRIFEEWNDPARREAWLPGAELTVRKAPGKSLRITWHDGGNLDVNLYPKGEARCQCTADHNKLSAVEDVDRMRAYWSAALDRLKARIAAEP